MPLDEYALMLAQRQIEEIGFMDVFEALHMDEEDFDLSELYNRFLHIKVVFDE